MYTLRKEQTLPLEPCNIWIFIGGRGCGKTFAGAHAIEALINNQYNRIGCISKTKTDARKVMLFGSSGFLNITKYNFKHNIRNSSVIVYRNKRACSLCST